MTPAGTQLEMLLPMRWLLQCRLHRWLLLLAMLWRVQLRRHTQRCCQRGEITCLSFCRHRLLLLLLQHLLLLLAAHSLQLLLLSLLHGPSSFAGQRSYCRSIASSIRLQTPGRNRVQGRCSAASSATCSCWCQACCAHSSCCQQLYIWACVGGTAATLKGGAAQSLMQPSSCCSCCQLQVLWRSMQLSCSLMLQLRLACALLRCIGGHRMHWAAASLLPVSACI
jgi:hypothetical protein